VTTTTQNTHTHTQANKRIVIAFARCINKFVCAVYSFIVVVLVAGAILVEEVLFWGEVKGGGRVGESEKVSEKISKHAQKYSNLLQQDTKYSISSQFQLKTTQINKALSP